MRRGLAPFTTAVMLSAEVAFWQGTPSVVFSHQVLSFPMSLRFHKMESSWEEGILAFRAPFLLSQYRTQDFCFMVLISWGVTAALSTKLTGFFKFGRTPFLNRLYFSYSVLQSRSYAGLKFPLWTAVAVWMRMALTGSYSWMFGYQLADCLRKTRRCGLVGRGGVSLEVSVEVLKACVRPRMPLLRFYLLLVYQT